MDHAPSKARSLALALFCYAFWGFFPLYFALPKTIPSLEVLAHRVLWGCFFLSFFLLKPRFRKTLIQLVSHRKTLLTLIGSALMICANWLTFLYAVHTHRTLESSLGYFLSPLLTVFLGRLFFAERLRFVQHLAILIVILQQAGYCKLSKKFENFGKS